MQTDTLPITDGKCSLAGGYARDGFVVAPGVLTRGECEALKAEAVALMREHAGSEATVMVGVAAASERFRRLAGDPRLVDVISPLMPDGVMFMSDKFVFKSGAKRFATPWHVDQAYWRGTRTKLSVWVALDDARRDNGCMRVLRGGHARDWAHRDGGGAGTNGEFPNVISDPDWNADDEVACEVPQGGAIVFGDRLPHASFTNESGKDRYALILTYHAPTADEPFDLGFPARHVLVQPPSASPR